MSMVAFFVGTLSVLLQVLSSSTLTLLSGLSLFSAGN